MNIIEYLDENNISVGTEYFKKDSILIDKTNIYNQVKLIDEIQKVFINKRGYILPPIGSTIGKELEGFKVKTKRLKKYLNEMSYKYNNSFNNYVIEELKNTIERAEKTINSIDNDKYIELIVRSMNNNEICLGKVDEGNLKKSGKTIQIRTTKYISCNLVEHDCYSYIRKLKKRGWVSEIEDIIVFFTAIKGLDKYSKEYLLILANYPIDSIKAFNRLREDSESLKQEEWVNVIMASKRIDGDELL